MKKFKKFVCVFLCVILSFSAIFYLGVGFFGNIEMREISGPVFLLYGGPNGSGGAEGKYLADVHSEELQALAGQKLSDDDIVQLGANMVWQGRQIWTSFRNDKDEVMSFKGKMIWGWSNDYNWEIHNGATQ